MEHTNIKEQNKDMESGNNNVEVDFEYDIFISYRHHDMRDPNRPKRGAGKKPSRYLYKKFEKEGYRVWYDNGAADLQSYLYMLKSKLCIILISDYSLAGIDWDDIIGPCDVNINGYSDENWTKLTSKDTGGKGILKELLTAYNLLKANKYNNDKRKPRVLFVSIDNGLQTYTDKDARFSWIKEWHIYENYHNFGELLQRVRGRGKDQFDIQPSYKYRKLFEKTKKALFIVFFLLLVAVSALSILGVKKNEDNSKPFFFIVGPGSVCEDLLSRGIMLNSGHLFYTHKHSDEAWENLRSAFRLNAQGGLGNFPIALSDIEMDTNDAKKILDGKKDSYCILQCLIDSIDLNVLVLQDTSKKEKQAFDLVKEIGTTKHKIDTLTLKRWYDNRKEYNLYIVGNSEVSNTRKAYSSFLNPGTGVSVDHVFHKYTPDSYAIINHHVKKCFQTVLILDNSTIENEKNKIVDSVASLSLSIDGKKLYLYAYTIVELVEAKTRFEFLNNQEEFFQNTLNMIGSTDIDKEVLENDKTEVPIIIKKQCILR